MGKKSKKEVRKHDKDKKKKRKVMLIELFVLILAISVFIYLSYITGFFVMGFGIENIFFYLTGSILFIVFVFLILKIAKDRKSSKKKKEVIKGRIEEKDGKTKEELKNREKKPTLKNINLPLKFKKEKKIYETDIDILYKLVQDQGKINLSLLAKYFNVDKRKIEHWSRILEEHKLVELHYPPIGEIEVMMPIPKNEKKEK